jgi:hypothetical protein
VFNNLIYICGYSSDKLEEYDPVKNNYKTLRVGFPSNNDDRVMFSFQDQLFTFGSYTLYQLNLR